MDENKENKTPEPSVLSKNDSTYQKHKDTPTRSKILGAKFFCTIKGYACSWADLEHAFGVATRSSKRIWQSQEPWTYHSQQEASGEPDQRGRPHKIPRAMMADVDCFLEEKGFPGRSLRWPMLAEENGIHVHGAPRMAGMPH
jgi:hypothetical protein